MISDRDFRKLLAHLDRPWAGYRKVRKGVKKRLHRHMAELGCSTIEQYLVEIAEPQARAACEQCLRVTISRFFRDQQLWQALAERILPDLNRRFAPHPLRIWSAGCACGEEAYSLAMLCQTSTPPITPVLMATDAQEECLRRAREGIYNRSSLKLLPDEMQTRYFDFSAHDRHAVIRQHLLPPVRWVAHDLTGDLFEADPFHMVLLRNNLLTYYQGTVAQAAFSRIISRLTCGGCLIVGSHEHLPGTGYPLIRDAGCSWLYWRRESQSVFSCS